MLNKLHFMVNDFFMDYKNIVKFDDKDSIYKCFKYFDEDNDETLNETEFYNLLKKLYTYKNDKDFLARDKLINFYKYYATYNTNNLIGFKEFEKFWNKTVRTTLFPRSALIIVDVQNDFIDGSLALRNCPAGQDGYEVIPVINQLIIDVPFSLIVYTQDWHPPNHISFFENLQKRKLSEKNKLTTIKPYDVVLFEGDIEQKLWPAHCIQYSNGAALHPKLKFYDDYKTLVIRKGTNPNIDSYSAFYDNNKKNRTDLNYELSKVGITDVYVCGVATDFCVGSTALDAIDLNYRVVLVQDACRGVNSIDIQTMKRKLIDKGALLVNSNEVRGMVECADRRVQLGYSTILNNSN